MRSPSYQIQYITIPIFLLEDVYPFLSSLPVISYYNLQKSEIHCSDKPVRIMTETHTVNHCDRVSILFWER